jgi:hypothetical protein
MHLTINFRIYLLSSIRKLKYTYISLTIIALSENEGEYMELKETRKVYGILVGKPEGKRPLGRPRCRWEDRIRMGIRGIVWGV